MGAGCALKLGAQTGVSLLIGIAAVEQETTEESETQHALHRTTDDMELAEETEGTERKGTSKRPSAADGARRPTSNGADRKTGKTADGGRLIGLAADLGYQE